MRKWAVLGGVAAIVLVYGETTGAHSIYSCRVLPTARDLTKNISVVTDPTCAFSGVGCITTLCRYCRVNSHTNYPNLLLCSDIKFAAPVPATIIPVPTTSVPSPVPTTRAPTPAPTISTLAPVPTTSEPLPFTETPASSGDSSQSEDPIFDPTEVDDAAFVLTCYTKVSSGDAAVGIGVITDVSCVLGGIGCVNDVCRYCQVRYTTQSSHLTPCSSVVLNNGDDIDFTPLPTLDSDDSGIVVGAIDRPLLYQIIIPDITAPVTIAPAPTTTAPPTTSVPTPATTTSAPTSTAPPVTATTPPPTTTAPTPIPTTRTPTPTTTSPAPATTVPATTAPTPAPTTVAPSPTTTAPPPTTVTPAPTTRAPTSTPTTTAPVPTPMAPAPTTRAPTPATTAPSPTATAPASTTRAPSSTTSAPTPTPAPTTRAPTPTTTAPAPTTRAPTPAPTTRAPVTTAPSATVDTCAASVSTGDASVGISAYTDSTCASGGLGCFNAKCRYCKTVDTLQSQHLPACKKAVDPCLSSVSGGDAAVGISAVTDTTCQAGGLGCFSSTCRYCKTMNTLQSQHLLFCSAL